MEAALGGGGSFGRWRQRWEVEAAGDQERWEERWEVEAAGDEDMIGKPRTTIVPANTSKAACVPAIVDEKCRTLEEKIQNARPCPHILNPYPLFSEMVAVSMARKWRGPSV